MADEVPDQATEILSDVKVMNDIKDDHLDAKFKIYIKHAIEEVELYVHTTMLPKQLTGVVTQMTQAKYVKAGNEGTTASSEEGLSLTFTSNDIQPFTGLLDHYLDGLKGNGHRGRVVTW